MDWWMWILILVLIVLIGVFFVVRNQRPGD